ncbi:non-specific lipid transfer protein GPI-anchored 15-like [Apium graveolens]|uniref:non-specific lipid transfer protein GPI-anchored 15-like n=1 Tax=Apium graveolens TaxID=4045 RepID=UPI003D7AD28E
MASKMIRMSLVLVLVVMLCGGAMAQSGCSSALLGLSSCLNYITGNSSTPSSSCCSQLGNVVQAQPQCLCTVLSGGAAALGLNINQTQALTLPSVCNVQTPPLSQCNTANGSPTSSAATPTSSPEGSPSDSSDETPDTPSDSNNPSGGGSKTVPSTDGTASDGRNIKVPVHIVLSALFIASCASAATKF